MLLRLFAIEFLSRTDFHCCCCCCCFCYCQSRCCCWMQSLFFCILSFNLIERSPTVGINLFVGIRRNEYLCRCALAHITEINICRSPPLISELCSIYNIRQISLATLVLLLYDSKYGTAFVYKTINSLRCFVYSYYNSA